MTFKVWQAATSQGLFSLGCSMGCLAMIASHNKFNHNVFRDALLATFMDSFIAILSGFVIFAYLGNLVRTEGQEDTNFESFLSNAGSGWNLPLVIFPHIIAKMDFCPQLLFVFLCLTCVSLCTGTVLIHVETIIITIMDHFKVCT